MIGVAPGAFAGAGMAQVVAVGPLALIGAEAFRDCPRLGQFILSSGLEEISGSAFENCGVLKGASFPPGLRRIGDRAFAGAAINRAILPASLTGLGKGTFQDCKALGEVVLPPSLRQIPPRAFAGCEALGKIALPHGLTAIGRKAFAGCSRLAVLDIPATVEEIAPDAFEGRGADFWIFCRMGSPLNDPLTYLRLFTHALGHAGWEHFIGNASYLLLLGPMLEEKHGTGKMLGVILAAALLAGVANSLFFPHTAVCGASGVVFAFILMTSFTGFREGELPLTFLLVAVFFIGKQVYEGLLVQDNVSNLSHILGGVTVGYQLNKK